jgi:hypothetical protein
MKTEKEKIEDLKSQFEYLKGERKKREPDWKEVQTLVAPSVFNWDNPLEKIPLRPHRFTSRPTHYLKTLVSGISGYSISPNIVWQKLGLEDAGQMDLYGVKDWLEMVERILYAEFKRSNLYPQTAKFIDYAASYGHAAMLVDEQLSDNRLRYTTHKISELYFDTNEYDEVDTVFRYFSMTLKNMAAFFGEDGLSESRKLEMKNRDNWNNDVTILHAVFPREDFDDDSWGKKNMDYASVYLDEGADHILLESGYEEFPYAVFIWDPVVGTAYGESPAIHALDDIRYLNKVSEYRLKNIQLSSDPAYNVPDSMREHVNVIPHGYNYYVNPNEIITPINPGANYPVTVDGEAAIENRVKDWFHVDFFLMLQHENSRIRTATEVMEMQGEKAAVLSDLVVSLNGALQKIIGRSFSILWRQRKLPPPPSVLMGSGAKLKVDFLGPLAQAQKKYHESSGVAQGLQLLGGVAQISPPALDVVDFDRLIKVGLESAGVSQLIIRDDEDVEKIRRERAMAEARAQQQALAMEQQKNLLSNYNKLNEPVTPGSAIDELNQTEGPQ